MSILLVANEPGDGWPSDSAVDRFREWAEARKRPVAVVTSRDAVGDDFDWRLTWTSAIARPWARGDGGVRMLLTGFKNPRLARRLRRECGADVPVYVAIPADDDRQGLLFDEFDAVSGVAAFRCEPPAGRPFGDFCTALVRIVDRLSGAYRSHVDGLRGIPSATRSSTAMDWNTYSTALDTFEAGGGVRDVGTVLDAMLDELCGPEPEVKTEVDVGGRWMTTLIEDGDRAAEDKWWLTRSGCAADAAFDHERRATRTAEAFAMSFWCDASCPPPTATDHALADCLIAQIRAAANDGGRLTYLSAELFTACLNAWFADARLRCSGPKARLFPSEVQERLRKFAGAEHLADLMRSREADDGDGAFCRRHVEHLEPHVLCQRLAEHVSRHFCRRVQYFALTDTLVFRFWDGKPGRLIERNGGRRLNGSQSFKRFHDELFQDLERTGRRPWASTVQADRYRYRDFGYADLADDTVLYVSASGETKIRLELYGLRKTGGGAEVEQRCRVKVECGDFWAVVHGVADGGHGRSWTTETTVGLADGTVVAVTEPPKPGLLPDMVARDADGKPSDSNPYEWPDGRPVLELYYGAEAVVTTVDGTWIVAKYGDALISDGVVCEVHVSDGAKFRCRTDRTVDYCPAEDVGSSPTTPERDDKYLVCRRDLSGYEFVGDAIGARRQVGTSSDGPPVVRTLVRNQFDDRVADELDEALANVLESVETLVDRFAGDGVLAEAGGPK